VISPDRLDELDTFRVDEDVPDDARISLPAADVRDLVRLVAVVRAGIALREAVVQAVITKRDVMAAVQRFDGERMGGGT
jgi:hypothetical protein